ncbi:MAG: hypothetical protein IJ688_04425 [Treponema sp.]|nr:hypothetical protein [Treponema sp.]
MKNTSSLFRFYIAILLLAGISILSACNHSAAEELNDNEAFLVFASASRAAEDSLEKLTDIVLKGTLKNEEEKELGKWTSWETLKTEVIKIKAGDWSFSLSAKIDGLSYSDSVEMTVKAGITNTVKFVLTETNPTGLELEVDIVEIDYTPRTVNLGHSKVTYTPCKDGIKVNVQATGDNAIRDIAAGNSIWVEKKDINSKSFEFVFPFVKYGQITDFYIGIDYDGLSRESNYIVQEDGIQAGGGYKIIDDICNLDVYNSIKYSSADNVLKAQGDYESLIKDNFIYLDDYVQLNFYSLVNAEVDDDSINTWAAWADVEADGLLGSGVSLFDILSKGTLNTVFKEESKNNDGSYRYAAAVTYFFKFKNGYIPGIDFDYTGFQFTHTDWINPWNKGKYIEGNYTPVTITPLQAGTVIWEKKDGESTVMPADEDAAAPERYLVIPGNKFQVGDSELTKDNTIRIYGKFDEEVNSCNIFFRSIWWKDWTLSGKGWIQGKRDLCKLHGYIDVPLANESAELIAEINTYGLTFFAWWSQQQYTKIEIVATQEKKADSEVLTFSLDTGDGDWKTSVLEAPITLDGHKYAKASVSVDKLDEGFNIHNVLVNLESQEKGHINNVSKWDVSSQNYVMYCELPDSGEINSIDYVIENKNDDSAVDYSLNNTITISLTLTDEIPSNVLFGYEDE